MNSVVVMDFQTLWDPLHSYRIKFEISPLHIHLQLGWMNSVVVMDFQTLWDSLHSYSIKKNWNFTLAHPPPIGWMNSVVVMDFQTLWDSLHSYSIKKNKNFILAYIYIYPPPPNYENVTNNLLKVYYKLWKSSSHTCFTFAFAKLKIKKKILWSNSRN